MSKILVEIDDSQEMMLIWLLNSLNFIKKVSIISKSTQTTATTEDSDFLSLTGIWEGRNIDLAILRQQAWPKYPK